MCNLCQCQFKKKIYSGRLFGWQLVDELMKWTALTFFYCPGLCPNAWDKFETILLQKYSIVKMQFLEAKILYFCSGWKVRSEKIQYFSGNSATICMCIFSQIKTFKPWQSFLHNKAKLFLILLLQRHWIKYCHFTHVTISKMQINCQKEKRNWLHLRCTMVTKERYFKDDCGI